VLDVCVLQVERVSSLWILLGVLVVVTAGL